MPVWKWTKNHYAVEWKTKNFSRPIESGAEGGKARCIGTEFTMYILTCGASLAAWHFGGTNGSPHSPTHTYDALSRRACLVPRQKALVSNTLFRYLAKPSLTEGKMLIMFRILQPANCLQPREKIFPIRPTITILPFHCDGKPLQYCRK